eukprot:6859003-Alexandrium_andersonii.AAC.1
MTAHGTPKTAIAVHKPRRNAGDASTVTRMWDWSGSCCSLRSLSWRSESARSRPTGSARRKLAGCSLSPPVASHQPSLGER